MAELDPQTPLPDISADEPCGPNLEFDGEFTEFERLAQGKPEQQYGTTIVPAEDPEWKLVVAAGWALLERTYDLRVFAQLAVGRLQREGVPGYAATLALARQVLETRWEKVHPQLDPEDDNDPMLRANALLTMAEPVRVMRFLRYMPLAKSPRTGTVNWREIAISAGTIEVEEDVAKLSDSTIGGTFRETDPAYLTATREALASASESATAISAAFDEQAGYGTGPDYTELLKLLGDMQRMIATYAVADAEALPDDAAEDAPGETAEPGEAAVARRGGGGGSVASLGPVQSRADAVRLLDLVVQYYERNEPSSPLPLLISRARRLADKGFLDLLRDLAPDGVQQAERIAGVEM